MRRFVDSSSDSSRTCQPFFRFYRSRRSIKNAGELYHDRITLVVTIVIIPAYNAVTLRRIGNINTLIVGFSERSTLAHITVVIKPDRPLRRQIDRQVIVDKPQIRSKLDIVPVFILEFFSVVVILFTEAHTGVP